MKTILEYIILTCLLATFTSCEVMESLYNESEIIIDTLHLEEYHNINISEPYILVFGKYATNEIIIEGQEQVVKNSAIHVDNNTLYLDHDKDIQITKENRIKVYLNSDSLSRIAVFASCHLITEDTLRSQNMVIYFSGEGKNSGSSLDIKCNYLYFALFGLGQYGEYTLNGKCNTLSALASGTSQINASKLETKNSKLIHRSKQNSIINCSDSLHVEIHSSGSTYYLGNPGLSISKIEYKGRDPLGDVYSY